MRKVSVVIPAWNEAAGISRTLAAVPRRELAESGWDVEVVVVDNGSTDETVQLARAAGACVVREPRRGYGRAIKAGYAYATGEVIVTADADGSYPLGILPLLLEYMDFHRLDFLTTDRLALLRDGAMSKRNQFGNEILSGVLRLLFRVPLRDSQSGMWLLRRHLLPRLKLRANTPLSQEVKIEACCYAGCRWAEIPVHYCPRVGRAKLGGWKVGFLNLLHLFKKRLWR